MEWLAFYVLTLSYCIAPEGKTVCEREQREYAFSDASDCIHARNELAILYDKYRNVIFYPGESKCHVEVKWVVSYPDKDEALQIGNIRLKNAVKVIGDDY